ncbi:hypothetical protein BS47DRAFT_1287079 [Hydnum rufescens UP504]|uniref:peptidyl-tRNA hydrolase n=1 Tax=Hydnum rufescens UP504 TaxID=1448309 RepID=A0A9P6BAK7_9AGAM|nr:hypothetical protein BS47DRAFT_1287079 [Hydnum rufescens UP504]
MTSGFSGASSEALDKSLPNSWIYGLVVVGIAAAVLGYYIGTRTVPPPYPVNPSTTNDTNINQNDPAIESDTREESQKNSPLIKPGAFEECKLVLVVRTDLGMTKGKIAAQCSHATLACYKSLMKSNPALVKHWERIGQAKIALRCDSEDELVLLQATAQSLNLCAQSIQDAGRTQIAAGSTTVLGIGPGPVDLINQVTGHLKLL